MNHNTVISFLRLRKYIGVMGLALPILLICTVGVQHSISLSYYTPFRDCLVGIFSAIGLFLFADKGYDLMDTICNRIAGICCLIIAYCPCEGQHIIWHYIAAFVLFLDLFFISTFLFTKNEYPKTVKEELRVGIFAIAGITIFSNLISIILSTWEQKPIFWAETYGLIAFGISWLLNGTNILKRKY